MQELNRGMDLRVTPFLTAGGSSTLASGEESNNWEQDVGLDMKYGLSSGLNLDLTVNTDFAQAEVDDEQVNLTRFLLFSSLKTRLFSREFESRVGSANPFNRYAELFQSSHRPHRERG